MSASSKKKLRNAEKAEMLTEKQQAAQKEAKNLKIFTTVMVLVVAAMVVFAIGVGIYNQLIVPQMAEKEAEAARNTVAVTVGEHDVSAVQYNCFYVDAVSNFYSTYGSYASLFGLDVTKALDQQTYDEETGTWADYFKTSAESNIKSVYAIYDEAMANGFTLTEEDEKYVDTQMSYMAVYALNYGYTNVKDYLEAMYGTGATEELVREYFELCYTAQMYQQSVADSMEYTADEIQAKDDENPALFSTFSYNSYYLSASKFLEGGTTAEDGTVTYSDEETAASVAAAEEAAKALTGADITSIVALDAAIAALPINAEAESAASTVCNNYTYGYVNSTIQEWVTSSDRQAGDLTYIPSTSTTTAEDGTETTSTTGYYVVYFSGRNDNEALMQNVRHILIVPEGGTTDSNGNTTYTDEEMAAARTEAEAVYEEWKAGEATEDSFAALAQEHSDDSTASDGGLITDIYPGQMVTTFNDWCFDEARQAGDTEIIDSEFGCHIMYYVGATDYTYREYQIENTLLNEDITAWHEALVEAVTLTVKDYQYVPTGMVLSSGSSY